MTWKCKCGTDNSDDSSVCSGCSKQISKFEEKKEFGVQAEPLDTEPEE